VHIVRTTAYNLVWRFVCESSKSKTVYQVVAGQIREQIIKGELKPGDQLPTEFELTEHYSVSRSSIRCAIELLVREGLVEKIHGKGSYVRVWRTAQSQGGIIGLLVPDQRKNFFLNMLEGVETGCKIAQFRDGF